MVRLQLILTVKLALLPLESQFHYGSITTEREVLSDNEFEVGLNSTMVRLQR